TLRGRSSPAVERPRQAISNRREAVGATYLRDRRAALATPVRPALFDPIDAAVRHLVRATTFHAGQHGGTLALFHLIGRGADRTYLRTIADVPVIPEILAMKVSGPWAPFAFAPELWP